MVTILKRTLFAAPKILLYFPSLHFPLPQMPVSHSSPTVTTLLLALPINSSNQTKTQHHHITKSVSLPESESTFPTFLHLCSGSQHSLFLDNFFPEVTPLQNFPTEVSPSISSTLTAEIWHGNLHLLQKTMSWSQISLKEQPHFFAHIQSKEDFLKRFFVV